MEEQEKRKTQQTTSASLPILSNIFENIKGEQAWNYNLNLASLAASKIESCLGPKGAYKIVTYHRGPELVVKVTKDAADIVDELGVQYPAVKTIAEAAKIHRSQVGDGVSTLLILVSALLTEAKKLIEKGIHPNAILDGYYNAAEKSVAIIDEIATESDTNLDEMLLEIVDCGRNLLSSKLGGIISEAVSAVSEDEKTGGSIDLKKIRMVKKPGASSEDSELLRGIIFRKGKAHPSMPDQIEAPRVAIVNKKLEIKPFELKMKGEGPFALRLNITNEKQLLMFKSEEKRLRAEVAEKVKSVGADVLICRSRIDERIAAQLSNEGILALQLVDQEDIDAAAKATGARIVADTDLLSTEDLGIARKIEVDRLPPDDIVILRCDKGTTLLLRGSSPELLQELEKIVRNAMLVLKHSRANSRVIPGAGAIFVQLAYKIRKYALTYPGREQFAMNSFSDALEKIPECLARNYGLDTIDVMTELRSHHSNGEHSMGVGERGCIDAREARLLELALINKAAIRRALELVSLMLRIDSYFYVKELPVFHRQ
ncbi:MAG: TCP-1/cpn60 chaperonin family protein [Nitrososphaerales archaeon]